MEHVAGFLEPGGVRGPSYVAKNLANAALVCHDFRYAAAHGFAALAQHVQQQLHQDKFNHPLHQLPGPGGWERWDKIVSNPHAFSIEELKAAAGSVGKSISSTTKQQVAQEMLQMFGLSAPCSIPAQMLAVVVGERNDHIILDVPNTTSTDHRSLRDWLQCKFHEPLRGLVALRCRGANTQVKPEALGYTRHSIPRTVCGGLAKIRAELLAAGVNSLQELLQLGLDEEIKFIAAKRAAAEARWQAHQQRVAEQQAAAQVDRQQKKAAKQVQLEQLVARHGQVMCSCGQVAAKWCARGCCGVCCRQAVDAERPCVRHK